MEVKFSEIASFCKNEALKMASFAEKKWGIDLSKFRILVLNKDISIYGRGGIIDGQPGIELFLGRLTDPSLKLNGFMEYASLNNNTVIGGFPTNDWRMFCLGIIAHEMSHVIQFCMIKGNTTVKSTGLRKVRVRNKMSLTNTFDGLGEWSSGHGNFFKRLLSVFRQEFVNPHVTGIGSFNRVSFEKSEEDKQDELKNSSIWRVRQDRKSRVTGALHDTDIHVILNPKRSKFQYLMIVNPGPHEKRYKIDSDTLKTNFEKVQ